MRVPTLHQAGLLLRRFIDRVVHKDLATDVGEGRVEAASDQDAPIVQTDSHRVALKGQGFGDKLFRPVVLREVVLKYHLGVVGVSKEVIFRDGLHFVVEKLESVLVGERDDVVFQGANVFKELGRVWKEGGNIFRRGQVHLL